MDNKILERLIDIVGADWVVSENSMIQSYLNDETEVKIKPVPNQDCIVVKPGTTEEVSLIMKAANELLFPVIPRGGGTGATGAVVPTEPSVIMSMERFKKIVELDKENLMITMETGVTLAEMNDYIAKNADNLYFPVHPGDEAAHIGGMAIENAGGVRAVRHGIMRNHIKGLKVVLPSGEIATYGGKLMKNNMGYDILHLLIGSEGTLAIVTEVIVKIYPKSGQSATLLVSFNNAREAIESVSDVLQKGIVPLAVEYMERELCVETAKHLGVTWPAQNDGTCDIMFIIEEPNEDLMFGNAEQIVEICEARGALDTILAESDKDQRNILEIRSNIYTAYKELFVDSLDTAVPPSSAADLLEDFKSIAKSYGTTTPAMGHLGDGNFHNFIMLDENGEVPSFVDDIRKDFYAAALKYGGSISAEHGTGKTRKKYLRQQFSESEIELMRNIKKAFDPNWILNPGTIFDRA